MRRLAVGVPRGCSANWRQLRILHLKQASAGAAAKIFRGIGPGNPGVTSNTAEPVRCFRRRLWDLLCHWDTVSLSGRAGNVEANSNSVYVEILSFRVKPSSLRFLPLPAERLPNLMQSAFDSTQFILFRRLQESSIFAYTRRYDGTLYAPGCC